MNDINNYEGIKAGACLFYKGIGKVYSPALQKEIHFTDVGFDHLVFKNGKERDRELQVSRFRSLPLVIKLLQKSTMYQDYVFSQQELEGKGDSQGGRKTMFVRYWGIAGIIDNKKIKVVVRRVGNDELKFWSVLPNQNRNRNHVKEEHNHD